MGTIWIKCPATGRRASTEIQTDETSFRRLPEQLKNFVCPACGLRHFWVKEDAWLEADMEWAHLKEAS
jgi:hypothetical protein